MSAAPVVLVVDDNEELLEATTRYLRQRGLEVITSGTPFGVLGLVRQHHPAVVVLDITMPALDGKAVAQLLGSHDDTRVPVVYYSALEEGKVRALAEEVGAAYALKGESLGALYEIVRRFIP